MKSYKPKKYVFWTTNEWKNCCLRKGHLSDFEFTLFYYSQGIVYTGDMAEHICYILTIFNFSFVLRIRRN